MLQHLKRKCRPTTFLLVIGFAISLTSVLIGISSINAIMVSLSEMDSETPIYLTMQNTGLSLALAIYFFQSQIALWLQIIGLSHSGTTWQFTKPLVGLICS